MATTPAHVPDGTASVSDDAAAALGGTPERYWYLFAISGLVSVVIGVLVLAYPDPSIKLLGVFLGIDLLIGGIALIVHGVSKNADEVEGPGALLVGTLGVIAGLVVIRNPAESLTLLALAFAVYLIVAGALALAQGLIHRKRRWSTLCRGLVLAAAGTVIISVPDIGLTTLAIVAGVSLVLQGAVELAEAYFLRRAPAPAEDRG